MKAIAHVRYGRPSSLELRDVDIPQPADDEVLVHVRASSVNPADWYAVTGLLPARFGNGLRRPKATAVGRDLAGVVEAVGNDVHGLQPGDEVFGTSDSSWAQYTTARPERVAVKPASVSFEEAAAVPIAGITALQALRDHGQVRRVRGCWSTAQPEESALSRSSSPRPSGPTSPPSAIVAKINTDDLGFLAELLEAGRIKAVVERTYPLHEAADALAHLGEGHATAKLVLTT